MTTRLEQKYNTLNINTNNEVDRANTMTSRRLIFDENYISNLEGQTKNVCKFLHVRCGRLICMKVWRLLNDYEMGFFKVSCGRLHPGEIFMNDGEMGWNFRLAVVGCTCTKIVKSENYF